MAVLISGEVKRKTGTHLPVKAADTDKKIANVFRLVKKKYEERLAGNAQLEPSGMADVFSTIAAYFVQENISEGMVFETWDRIPDPNDSVFAAKHLIGWLLAYSNAFEKTTAQIAERLKLSPPYNPWPTIFARPEQEAELKAYHARIDAQKKADYSMLPEPSAYSDGLGGLVGHHFLIIESSANADGAIAQLLLGATRHARRTGLPVNGVILDLTGERCLGLEMDPTTVYLAGEVPKEFQGELTERHAWFLPQMEALWQAKVVMDDRIKQKQSQARMGQPCDLYSPYYLVIRRWNRVLKEWEKVIKDKDFMLEALRKWREVYGHRPDDVINIQDEVDRILDLGDTCNIILILTISRFGKVEAIGMTQNELNSMVIIILADASVERGFRAINAALSDSRLDFCEAADKAELRKTIEIGHAFSASEGHQIALVNREPAHVMVIEMWQTDARGDQVSIRDYKADVIKGFNCAPSLPGKTSQMVIGPRTDGSRSTPTPAVPQPLGNHR